MKKFLMIPMLVAVLLVSMSLILVGCGNSSGNNTPPPNIMINQIFGGRGGNENTPISHDFIELYNSKNSYVDISNWTLHVSSSRMRAFSGTRVFPNGTVIPARHSFLIRGAAMTSSTFLREENPIPHVLEILAYDMDWINAVLDNDDYMHVVLRDSEGYVIDAFSNRAGAPLRGEVASNTTSRQRSARRINFQNTNDNASDFQGVAWGISNNLGLNGIRGVVETHRPRSLADGAWGM